jgi:hypothetical protein
VSAWVQWVIAAAAITTAVGVLFRKVLGPGYRAAGTIEDALPVFRAFTATFKGKTDVFVTLDNIAAQFRADDGSSLRDAIDGLEKAAKEAMTAAEANRRIAEKAADDNRRANDSLAIRFEAQRLVDEQRGLQQERMMLQVDRLMVRVDQLMASGVRIEASRDQVATDLTAREKLLDAATSGVASDLAASQKRADDTTGEAGAAADAASHTPDREDPA